MNRDAASGAADELCRSRTAAAGLRRFTDFYCEEAPKHDAFNRSFNRLTPATLKAINDLVVEAAVKLVRLAMKMATGSGKTTVMAMLIAWHTVNVVRSPNSDRFLRGFLIIAPGITIRDRLRVLHPADPDNYYAGRHLVPMDMVPEISKAKIVIANYHAFGRRRILETNKVGEAALSSWREEKIITDETDGEMLQRAAAIC